jgi:hypothetical protein
LCNAASLFHQDEITLGYSIELRECEGFKNITHGVISRPDEHQSSSDYDITIFGSSVYRLC